MCLCFNRKLRENSEGGGGGCGCGLKGKMKNCAAERVAKMKKPTAKLALDDIDLAGVGTGGLTFKAKVMVYNPYACALPMYTSSFTLKVGKSDKSDTVTGQIPNPDSLKGKKETPLLVTAKVPFSFAGAILSNVIADWTIDYELNVIVNVGLPMVGNNPVSFTFKGTHKMNILGL